MGVTLSALFWCQKLSLSLLYFNKTLLHKSSERLNLITGSWLNSSPPVAKNPSVFHDSAITFHCYVVSHGIWIHHSVFICPLVDGHWVCFQFGAILTKVVIHQIWSKPSAHTLWMWGWINTLWYIHIRCYKHSFGGFPGSSAGKETTCDAGDYSSKGWEVPLEKG